MSQVNNWKETADRYVAFVDIMGFKDLVAREAHEKIYDLMKKIHESKNLTESISWGKFETNLVKITSYSDSIMLYSKDNTYEAFYSLVCSVASLTSDLFIEGIPHKGALAYGTMTLDDKRSIFFGQPLIDAYLLQEELSFYGVVLHSSAEFCLQSYKEKDSIPFLEEYLVPFKGSASTHLTIHPIDAIFDSTGDKERDLELTNATERLNAEIHNLRYKTSGHLRKYIENTEAYIIYIAGLA